MGFLQMGYRRECNEGPSLGRIILLDFRRVVHLITGRNRRLAYRSVSVSGRKLGRLDRLGLLAELRALPGKASEWNIWPEVRDSTAFNADFRGGNLRACINGDIRGLDNGYPYGDTYTGLWGCMGECIQDTGSIVALITTLA